MCKEIENSAFGAQLFGGLFFEPARYAISGSFAEVRSNLDRPQDHPRTAIDDARLFLLLFPVKNRRSDVIRQKEPDQKGSTLSCHLNWIWLTCEFNGDANHTLIEHLKLALGLGEKQSQISALLVIGDVKEENTMDVFKAWPIEVIVFVVLLLLYLLIVVYVAIRGLIPKESKKSDKSSNSLNESDESLPKFTFSRFDEQKF